MVETPQLNPRSAVRPYRASRVLVVDDHPAIRQGLVSLINAEPEFEICGEAESFHEGLTCARLLKPDAVVVDISLPDSSGLELIKVIRAELPHVPVLVISVYDESQYALRALQAGALGYIMKADAAATILEGLRKVLAGELHVSPKFSERLIFQVLQGKKGAVFSPVERFSPREREILELLGRGMGTRDIAARLDISPKTVETHRGHMKEKLGVRSTGELVRFALDWVIQQEFV